MCLGYKFGMICVVFSYGLASFICYRKNNYFVPKYENPPYKCEYENLCYKITRLNSKLLNFFLN